MAEINDPIIIALIGLSGGIIGSLGSYLLIYRFEHQKQRLHIKENIGNKASEIRIQLHEILNKIEYDQFEDYASTRIKLNILISEISTLYLLYFKSKDDYRSINSKLNPLIKNLYDVALNRFENNIKLSPDELENFRNEITILNVHIFNKVRDAKLLL